ncbi:Cys-tRNA(Pro)/Cys-tRNA(Cys) deacylase [Allopseudospirillum japonicum]|uniref:Cys-tRNA(Pro)/Cys-tRNA(Cys) deacylase n=1 Tax=Allopseudospirillum japonicum TaxID=64971 RepID=A0A1H6UKV1_9GAMM|nr:Cys-tRNA(Pro) deacylase [Allopseudospirillum japonicum]SEI92306.1 Cys-tRNA(Pro)/Cys-tRNA(Cys) deacylase [Allopseudospirillum japonicum]
MTPAILQAQKAQIDFKIHQYTHDPNASSYGLEAAQALQQDPQRVFKTLMVEAQTIGLLVAVLPVAYQLNLKALARAAGVKKVQMAAKEAAQVATGYLVGGISPLGQKKPLPTFIDQSAQQWASIFISGGRRGLEIEIAAQDLAQLTQASFATLATDTAL